MGDADREHSLVRRAIGGDEVALKVLLARSRPDLCDYVSRRIPANLSRIVGPEDIVQEVHVRVFQRVGELESNRAESFHRWVRTIALRQLRNTIKQHRAAKRGGGRVAVESYKRNIDDSTIALFEMLTASGRTPSRSVARLEAIEAVQAALIDLPDHYSQAVRLVHLEGRSIRETAREMGRTERAIHGLCRRGLKQLQNRLGSATKFLSSGG